MTEKTSFDVEAYDGGVVRIDSGLVRDAMTACYLVEAGNEAAFIEVGSNTNAQRLMQVLEMRGWKPEDVRYVIVTHVHLDHAGGAGRLMQLLPRATLLAHPYGARHMIDPAKLEAGTRMVYGDETYDRIYGTLVPVPEARVRVMEDGDSVGLGNRRLTFMDTPGHARHHFCVHDSLTNGWFTGDTFGLSYREFDTDNGAFLIPTTTPVQFDPEALKQSVARLVADGPECMYLTHYGRVGDVQQLAGQMTGGIDAMVEIALRFRDAEQRHEKIVDAFSGWVLGALRAHGVTLPDERCLDILGPDLDLNATGIEIWMDRTAG